MKEQDGSVSVIVAAIVAAMVILGLGAADLARVLVSASRAQTAADAASLAAATLAARSGLAKVAQAAWAAPPAAPQPASSVQRARSTQPWSPFFKMGSASPWTS